MASLCLRHILFDEAGVTLHILAVRGESFAGRAIITIFLFIEFECGIRKFGGGSVFQLARITRIASPKLIVGRIGGDLFIDREFNIVGAIVQGLRGDDDLVF